MTNSDAPDSDAPAEDLVDEADERRESQEEPVEGSKLVEGTDDDVEFAN